MKLQPGRTDEQCTEVRAQVRFCLWLVLLGLRASLVLAEPQDYSIRAWQIEDGLPQNSVTSIVQTPDGYLWLGTFNGLARFDGARFTVFDENNTPGLPSSRLVRLDVDQNGALWILAETGALTRFREGRFRTYTEREGLPAAGAAAVVRGPGDRILLVDRAGGLSRLKDERWVPEPGAESVAGRRFSLIVDGEGTPWLWLRDQGTLGRLTGAELRFLHGPEGAGPVRVRAYAPSQDGNFWLLLTNRVWSYNYRRSEWKSTPWLLPESARALMHLLEDRRGNLWLATYGSGLVRFGPSGEVEQLTADNGLSHNAVRTLCEDREGNLWVGTDGGGLNRLTPRAVRMWGVRQGLSAPVVMSVVQHPDEPDTLWLGLNGGGLNRWQSGQVMPRVVEPGLSNNSFIYGLLMDREGGLWVGNYDLGIFRYHHDRLWALPGIEPPGGQPLLAGLQDRNGTVWLGGGFGLCRWAHGALTNLNAHLGSSNVTVRALAEDQLGRVYIGSFGQGLIRCVGGQWTRWGQEDGLSDDHISALYVDSQNTLWIGTFHGGLSRFKNEHFVNFSLPEGLPSNCIFSLVEDDSGHLWCGSNRGIFRLSTAELRALEESGGSSRLTPYLCGLADGLSTLECGGGAQPSAIKAPDGKLWFATVKGLAMVNPAELPFNRLPPPVLIEEVRVADQVVAPGTGPAQTGLPLLTIPSRRPQRLEIYFTALSLVAPEKVRFRYRLRGLEEAWVDGSARRSASYPFVPPGSYRFEVTACNNHGVWNESGTALAITVLPPWWMTWWFRTGCVLAAGGLVFWLAELRLRRLRRERSLQTAFAHRLIELQEQERKRIAGELHDGLGQNLLAIKNRALLGLRERPQQDGSHSHLEEISQIAARSINDVREISRNLRPYQLDRLGLTKAIEAMASTVSQSSGIPCETDLDSLHDALPKGAEIHLYRIVQELLNNLVKHSDAARARITLKRSPDLLRLRLEDDGRGFEFDAVLDRPVRDQGLGLTDIAERVRLLGGKLQCTTRPGEGTRWEVVLPLSCQSAVAFSHPSG